MTSRFSASANSWNTAATPMANAAWAEAMVTSMPPRRICPASGWWTPEIIRASVDFPAALSPTSATTSPARTVRSTSTSASTPPKCLLTERSLRSGGRASMPVILPPIRPARR